jgi:hypothetical protein
VPANTTGAVLSKAAVIGIMFAFECVHMRVLVLSPLCVPRTHAHTYAPHACLLLARCLRRACPPPARWTTMGRSSTSC